MTNLDETLTVVPHLPLRYVPTARLEILDLAKRGFYRDGYRQLGYSEHDGNVANASMCEALRVSTLWWVADDMVTLFDHAAPNMPSQTLHVEDRPDPVGIVFFEHPISGVESLSSNSGFNLQVSAMMWYPAYFYVSVPMLVIESFVQLEMESGQRFWTWVGQGSWPLGGDFEAPPNGGRWENDLERASTIEDRRRIAAIWTLSQQEGLASRRDVTPARSDRRRAERVNIDPSDLRVITLRQLAGREDVDQTSDRIYSHRWMVSGHWRNQYLPSRDAHRLQWIAPHVKGPEDKPLVLKETVKAWIR